MNETQRAINELKEAIAELEKKLQEPVLDHPCILVDNEDNEVYALLYYKNEDEEGWADPTKGYHFINEPNSNYRVVRYLTDEEILELGKTGTISDLGEYYDQKLVKECEDEGWIYLGWSNYAREKDMNKYQYQIHSADIWEDTKFKHLSKYSNYRKKPR